MLSPRSNSVRRRLAPPGGSGEAAWVGPGPSEPEGSPGRGREKGRGPEARRAEPALSVSVESGLWPQGRYGAAQTGQSRALLRRAGPRPARGDTVFSANCPGHLRPRRRRLPGVWPQPLPPRLHPALATSGLRHRRLPAKPPRGRVAGAGRTDRASRPRQRRGTSAQRLCVAGLRAGSPGQATRATREHHGCSCSRGEQPQESLALPSSGSQPAAPTRNQGSRDTRPGLGRGPRARPGK